MAVNSFSQGAVRSAVPLPVTTATATTSATTTDVTVTWTPDTKGAVPSVYTVTGTATGGFTTFATTTATSVTMVRQNGGRAYTFAVASQNEYGSSTANASATPPFVYQEALTAINTQNYTIPTGYSKMAAIVYGGGGNGTTTSLNSGAGSNGGKGGAGAGAVAFQEYSITQGQVYQVTVGTAGGQSKITAPGSVIIAQANGGGQGGVGTGTNAGGTATSQVAVNATITGGTGGGGSSGENGSNTVGQAGGAASATTFTVLTAYPLPNPLATNLGGGGGGGSGFVVTDGRYGAGFGSNQIGGAASNGGVTGESGTYGRSGSGGAGGGFAAGVNQAGGVGRVVIYVA
jgi:hypothetical protein